MYMHDIINKMNPDVNTFGFQGLCQESTRCLGLQSVFRHPSVDEILVSKDRLKGWNKCCMFSKSNCCMLCSWNNCPLNGINLHLMPDIHTYMHVSPCMEDWWQILGIFIAMKAIALIISGICQNISLSQPATCIGVWLCFYTNYPITSNAFNCYCYQDLYRYMNLLIPCYLQWWKSSGPNRIQSKRGEKVEACGNTPIQVPVHPNL